MGSFIKLPPDIIAYMPICKFITSKNRFNDVPNVNAVSAGEMPAAQELITVFRSFQGLLASYSSLISYDGDRMKKTIEAFVETDRG